MNTRPRDGAVRAPSKTKRGIRLKDDLNAPIPTDPLLRLAFLEGAAAPVERAHQCPWSDLIPLLLSPKPGLKGGPAWMPADIDPGPRTAERVRSWSVLALDIEAETKADRDTHIKRVVGPAPPPLDELLPEIRAAGWQCLAHTTHSHLDPTIEPTDQPHHRYRLVFAVSRPLAPSEIKPLGLEVVDRLGLRACCDTKCLEPARLLFLPRCPPERLALFQCEAIEGAPLDVEELLTAARRVAAADTPAAPRRSDNISERPGVILAFNAAHDIGALLERHGYIRKRGSRWLYSESASGMPGVRLLSATGKVYSSHGGDPLNDGHPHDAFDVFRLLEHAGDQKAAVREAARLLGLNRSRVANSSPPPDSHDPPPTPPTEPDQGGAGVPPENLRLYPYLWRGGLFYLIRTVQGRGPDSPATETLVPLGNFSAIVIEQRQRDDGDTVENRSLIRVFQPRGKRIAHTDIEIPTERFAGLTWITPQLGHHYVMAAGNSIRDHLRACIQTFSGHQGMATRKVYTHTGWRQIDGELCYLHADGAITAQGARTDLDVDLSDCPGYRLPPPPAPPALHQAIAATLRLLDLAPKHPGIGVLQLARIAAPPLARWFRLDVSPFVVGRTGSLKTELAALAMQHYGDFTARALPGNWESSEGALLLKAHAAKDALFEVDDFNPSGSAHDQTQLGKRADRVFRGAANSAGRERLTSDIKLRKGQYPRGMVSASGEDVPPGRSLRARLWVAELPLGAIDTAKLTDCQRDAASGIYRQTLSGYLQWLAAHADELATSLPARHEALRNAAPEALRSHGRIPSNLAALLVAVETFVQFAIDAGAITREQGETLHRSARDALVEQARAQCDLQEASDEATRFLEMLRSALATGKGHLVSVAHLPVERPPLPHAEHLGWRGHRAPDKESDEPRWEPLGEKVGYVKDSQVWLDPESLYTLISRIARDQNAGALRTKARLGSSLVEKGILIPGDGRNVGCRHGNPSIKPSRVWKMSLTTLLG